MWLLTAKKQNKKENTRRTNADIGRLNHRNIIAAVANRTRLFASILFYQFNNSS
jgi:hypothetical protein